MINKLLKYGLGVYAPATPGTFAVAKEKRIDIPVGTDAGDIRIGVDASRYVISMGEGSRAAFIEDPEGDGTVSVSLTLAARSSAVWTSRHFNKGLVHRSLGEGGFTRSEVVTTLAGEGASFEARAAFRGDGTDVIDLRHEIIHAAPRTTSDLRLRGVLAGSAKAFARGLVRIPKGMPGCIGRQKEEIIMLSNKAEVSTMPDLEIASHEVQCGHAATIGRIDPEKLHYFESRGIPREEATEMIVEGFLNLSS